MSVETVHVGVYNTLADWEVGHAIAHINKSDWQKRPERYRVQTVGLTAEAVTTMGGVRIVPDLALSDLQPSDSAMLILAGADTWGNEAMAAMARRAGDFLAAGVPVAAICGATLGLAQEGLLNDRAHTSNAPQYLATAPRYTGADLYRDEPAVTDRNLITASAIFPVDFARHIFRALDLYSPAVLEAWYGLYTTGDPKWFYELHSASEAQGSGSQGVEPTSSTVS